MLNQNMETFKESIKRRKLEDMPNEVLLKIFSYLDTEEILKCAQTSKRMNEICKDKSLWQKKKVSLENQVHFWEHLGVILLHNGIVHLDQLSKKMISLFNSSSKTIIIFKVNLSNVTLIVGNVEVYDIFIRANDQ